MANEKVWTPEQREAAVKEIHRRSGNKFIPSHFVSNLQCELTEAVEIIDELRKFRSDGYTPEADAWLERNTGGSDGK